MRRRWVLLSLLGLGGAIGCSAITATDTDQLRPPGTVSDAGGGMTDAGRPPPGDAAGTDAARPVDDAGGNTSDACTPRTEVCTNGADDDCDSLVDAADPDCAPPPPPDFCETPGTLTLGAPAHGNTTGLVDDTASACRTPGAAGTYPDVFYTLRVPTDGDLYLDTFGSMFDTVVSLRDACELGSEFACSNDANVSRTSRVIYRNLPHGEYVVVVDGDRASPAGNYTLTASTMPSPPRLTCENPLDITGGGAVYGRTEGASNASGPCGGFDAPEEVFQFTLTARTMVLLRTAGSDFDTVLYVRPRTCSAASGGMSLACNDDTAGSTAAGLDLDLMAGTYFVFVDGASGGAGNYRFVAYFEPR